MEFISPACPVCNQQCSTRVNRFDVIFVNNARQPCVPALLDLSAPKPHVSQIGRGISSDDIAQNHLMIDYVKDKVASDATYAVTFVTNGKLSRDAMHTITAPVANFAPKESTSPVSSAAVTEFLSLRQGITRLVRDTLKRPSIKKRRTQTSEVGRTCGHSTNMTESCYRQVVCQIHQ